MFYCHVLRLIAGFYSSMKLASLAQCLLLSSSSGLPEILKFETGPPTQIAGKCCLTEPFQAMFPPQSHPPSPWRVRNWPLHVLGDVLTAALVAVMAGHHTGLFVGLLGRDCSALRTGATCARLCISDPQPTPGTGWGTELVYPLKHCRLRVHNSF